MAVRGKTTSMLRDGLFMNYTISQDATAHQSSLQKARLIAIADRPIISKEKNGVLKRKPLYQDLDQDGGLPRKILISNEGQSQLEVQAQPRIELPRVEDIQRLTTLDSPIRKLLPAFQQLWTALEIIPPEYFVYETAHRNVKEWIQELRGNLLQQKAQAQAENQASQQGPGRSIQQQQQELQIHQYLLQHFESLQIKLHQSIPQDTPEQLNDMKQSHLLALRKIEQAENLITRLKEAVEKTKTHGKDISAMQMKNNNLVQVFNGNKQFIEDVRRKRVTGKSHASQTI